VHPSVFDVAAILVEYCPAGHSCVVQLVFTPDPAYVPNKQFVHPSVLEVAFNLVDYLPIGHS